MTGQQELIDEALPIAPEAVREPLATYDEFVGRFADGLEEAGWDLEEAAAANPDLFETDPAVDEAQAALDEFDVEVANGVRQPVDVRDVADRRTTPTGTGSVFPPTFRPRPRHLSPARSRCPRVRTWPSTRRPRKRFRILPGPGRHRRRHARRSPGRAPGSSRDDRGDLGEHE
ncbi:MAG: hypothetical protein R2695_21130 [Acidimicrobiales bacterium]